MNPLHQFEITPIIQLHIGKYDISITNSSIFMLFSCFAVISFLHLCGKKPKLVPSKKQAAFEMIYVFIKKTVEDNIKKDSDKYIPFIFSLFIFIFCLNAFGLLPYSFTATSHISVTMCLSMIVFITMLVVGLSKHKIHFLNLFVPGGTPKWLIPLLFIIEFFTFISRPFSLALRLAANMIAGHVLIKVIASFASMMAIYFKIAPIFFIVILIAFEFFVAVLQAYIFSVLTCVYLNDVINLHNE